MHERQMGLIGQYYDDQWTNFALVLRENGDYNSAEQLEFQIMVQNIQIPLTVWHI